MSGPAEALSINEHSLSQSAREPLSVRALIERYHGSLISFLRQRLRIADDAADVAQEAYINMLQYEGSREVKSPSSLLFRVAINVANDVGRYEQVRHAADHFDLDNLDMDSGMATPERKVAAAQDLDLLYTAIENLPPRCQQVFLLSRVHSLTYPQIAKHCGISVKMVEKHVSHALAVCLARVENG